MAEQQKKTAEWILDGSFKVVDDVRDGLENAAAYFIGMLKGESMSF
jgi:NADPH-dependent curcumin reductase CurA